MAKLGRSPHQLVEPSGIGFGCMGITAFYGEPMADSAAMELLKGVYDAGCRHFDTAETYKTGNCLDLHEKDATYNEVVLGQFFKTVPRSSFTAATKFWPGAHEDRTDYETVKAACELSLRRLGLQYIDVYYCHRVPSKHHVMEFMHSAKRLVQEGLIKGVGLCETCGSWLSEAYEIHPVLCVQQEWSLLTRNLETDILPVCAELSVGVVAFSPMSRGLLATPNVKPADEFRAGFPRFSEDNFKQNTELVNKVQVIAEKKSVSVAQLSLAWLIHKAAQLGVTVLPIPGSTKLANAKANIASVCIPMLADEMEALEGLAANVAGLRFPEGGMKLAVESQADYLLPRAKKARIATMTAGVGFKLIDSGILRVLEDTDSFYGDVKAKCKGRAGLTWGHIGSLPEYLYPPTGANAPVVALVEPGVTIADAAAEVNKLIDISIHTRGAIYLRGLPVKTADEFSEFMRHLKWKPMLMEGGSTDRDEVADLVRTASNDPPECTLEPHMDLAHSPTHPTKIAFFCLQGAPPGDVGGETLLTDNRAVTRELLAAGLDQEFDQRGGIRYHKKLWSEDHKTKFTWQSRFFTKTKEGVMSALERLGSFDKITWSADDVLEYSNARPVTRRHPETGELLWFNGVATNHHSWYAQCYGLTQEESPFETTFGDGEALPDSMLEKIRSANWNCSSCFKMQDGDLILVDNMLMQHGRMSWLPEVTRKHLVVHCDARAT